MIEKHIKILNTNPFFCSLLFQAFYKGFEKKQCSILLQYLVLPIVLYSETRNTLEKLTTKTDFENYVESNKLYLIELQDRIWELKNLTNRTLIYLHSHNKINLDAEIEILEPITYENFSDEIKTNLRASHYLGYLFSNMETSEVYRTLNVIP